MRVHFRSIKGHTDALMSLAFKGKMGNKYYRVNTFEKELWDGKGVGEDSHMEYGNERT
jgi:hypothetical protein